MYKYEGQVWFFKSFFFFFQKDCPAMLNLDLETPECCFQVKCFSNPLVSMKLKVEQPIWMKFNNDVLALLCKNMHSAMMHTKFNTVNWHHRFVLQ